MNKCFSLSESICKTDNSFIIASQNVNLIFELFDDSSEYKVLGSIPEESFFSYRLVGSIEKYNSKLVFIPGTASDIWILDLITNEWDKVEIKNKEMIGGVKFLSSCIHKDKIFMFGCHYPAIVSLDMNTYETYYDFESIQPLYKKAKERSDCFFRKDIVYTDGMIYLACCSENAVLKYDPELLRGEILRIGNEYDRFSGIAYDGDSFWIAPRLFGDVIKLTNGTEKRFVLPKMQSNYSVLFSLGIVIDKNNNIVVPNVNYDYQYIKLKNQDKFDAIKSKNKMFYKCLNDQIVSIDREGKIEIYNNNNLRSILICLNDIKVMSYLSESNVLDIKSNYISESDIPLSVFLNKI